MKNLYFDWGKLIDNIMYFAFTLCNTCGAVKDNKITGGKNNDTILKKELYILFVYNAIYNIYVAVIFLYWYKNRLYSKMEFLQAL